MTAKAVAKKEEGGLPAEMQDLFMEDQGSGMETMGADDLVIPYLTILQALSPQVKKKDPAYVEGAEEGMFFNTATEDLYDGEKGVTVIPVAYMRRHTEWIPRSKGGGLVNDYGSDDSILSRCSRGERGGYTTPEGNDLVISGTHYLFIVDEELGTVKRAVLSLAGTQLKKSRRWNTMMQDMKETATKDGKKVTFTPASFFWAYRLTSVPESNDKGSWMGIKIEPVKRVIELPEGMEIYKAAREFKQQVIEGQVKAAPEPEAHMASANSEETDEEMPF